MRRCLDLDPIVGLGSYLVAGGIFESLPVEEGRVREEGGDVGRNLLLVPATEDRLRISQRRARMLEPSTRTRFGVPKE